MPIDLLSRGPVLHTRPLVGQEVTRAVVEDERSRDQSGNDKGKDKLLALKQIEYSISTRAHVGLDVGGDYMLDHCGSSLVE